MHVLRNNFLLKTCKEKENSPTNYLEKSHNENLIWNRIVAALAFYYILTQNFSALQFFVHVIKVVIKKFLPRKKSSIKVSVSFLTKGQK
jgi:hypothetical protein